MTSMSGGCLCGAVRFTVEAAESGFDACHCGMCRRWGGGPVFGTTVQGLRFEDESNLSIYSSSDWAERSFCKVCGSNLFYHLKGTEAYFVCVGAFDDFSAFTLKGEIFVDHKPEGYAFKGDLRQMTEAEVMATFASGKTE